MTTRAEFFFMHRTMFHELIDTMFDPDVNVMEWFDLRSDEELVAICFFAMQLKEVTNILGMVLLHQVGVRGMDLDKMRSPAGVT